LLIRLLIDECVDERLRLLFPDHECQTARFAKPAGLKNGQLLDAAEAAGFHVLITVDQNIPDQQNLVGRGISIVYSVRVHEPLARPGATCASRDSGAWLRTPRRGREHPVIRSVSIAVH
jgi:hypothetical protein